jgi:hypothetical protein
MGFLKNFFQNVFQEGEAPEAGLHSSFDHLTKDELEAHLGVRKYGSFLLTEAIRPSYDLKVVPRQGYRHDAYHDVETNTNLPVIMASASTEKLFELFIELLEPLGHVVDVVLETSHARDRGGHVDLYREHMDMPVLLSTLWDFEDLLTNDGCTGIAVLNPSIPQEIQFDEHKLLIVYGQNLKPYERVLESYGVGADNEIKFITEAEHVHSSSEAYAQQFEELKMRLGMDANYG